MDTTKQTTVPSVFVNGNHVGGYDNTSKAQKEGRLAKMLNPDTTKQTSSVQPKPGQPIDSFVNDLIRLNDIVIFSKTTCPFCAKVKELFKSLNHEYVSVELDAIGKLTLISF